MAKVPYPRSRSLFFGFVQICCSCNAKTYEISLDDKGYLVQANIGDPNPQGLVQAGVKWYEDFPNLDLSMLKDGAK